MNLKKISFILAVLLVAVVALGSVAAAEDIADDVTAISDDDSIEADLDSAEADLGSVDDVVESVPEEVSDEVVLEDVEEIEETRDITYTNHQVDAKKNSLGDSILSESTDSNQFKNSGFDEGLNDWILYNQDPLHPDVLAYLKTDGQQGNCLFVPWDSSVAFQFISQENINYTSISGIRFKAKNNSMGPVEIKLFDDNGENCLYTLSISSSQSWVEYEIPSTAFESLTDNLFHKFILRVSVSFAMDTSNEGCWLDDFETIPAAAPSQTETTLIVVEDGNNLAVTFKDVDGNAVAGDVKVYNGEELIGTLTFDGGNTTKTIAKPSVAGGSTVTITAKFEGNEAYAASTSEPISYVAPYNADDIQELFDNVEEGGVINLVAGAIYDVGSTQFTLTKKVTVNGNGATIIASGAAQGGQGAVIIAKVAGTAFKDIIFKNSDGHKEYGEGVAGYAIELAIENGTVDNCMFLDWSSGIYGRGAAFCNITNCYFNGSSDLVTGAGKGEKGTKAINLMGSHDITVKECTFEGQVLDGISIASNSGHNIMTDNTFIDNVYAIYFGGASTQGCVIANNTFIRCGYCPNVTDDINKKVTILSTQKACNGFIIADNFIEALSGTTFISMESGNTAHGYPSTIGDINVTGNTLALAEGAVAQTITFVKIVSNEGELSPYAPINISGNDLADGVTPVKVWYADWGSEDNPVIPAADPVVTSIEIVDVSTATKKLTVKLVDIGGEALAGETITYSINGAEAKIAETDEDGLVTIDVTENGVVAIAFEGNDQYKSAETSINFAATAQRTETQIIYQNMTTTAVDTKSDGRIGKYFIITLKDSTGKAIANKPVQIGFNGVVYDRVTDENGQAKLQINLKAEGVYTFAVAFLGDDQYNGSFVVAKITVSKQKGSLTVPAKSYAASAATKTLTATFKSAKGNPVAGKKVTFTVNGKTYSATTNAKGVATVKVSLNKKGTYSFTAKFAGDNTYAAISKSAKLTIK